ncbi:MAG: hypothetical protein H7263_04625 [Candidatus Sericytochromatia bacterium]|nr:hypothetical protein [Candidatus Sericytochromatia bacterium]
MAKDSKDKSSLKLSKSGSSNSKVDFLNGGMDFLDREILNGIDVEDLSAEDLADPELSDLDEEFEDDDIITIEENVSEEEKVKEIKTGKVTLISRKVSVKKPVANDKEDVEKEVNKLVKDLVKGVSQSEAKETINLSSRHKEQMINGSMNFLARDKVSNEEKKEFLSKLDEITSSEEVSNANASFVLKWLNNRK